MRLQAGWPDLGRRTASPTNASPDQAVLSAAGFALGLLALVTVFVLTSAAVARADLLINEILSAPSTDWDGDGLVDFKGDEWVEILNTGPDVEPLGGVYLRDGTGDTYHYGFSGTLAAGQTLVVYGSDSVAWQTDQGLSTTGLSLNNSGDRVELWRDVLEPRVLDALDAVDVPSHAAAAERAYGRAVDTLAWMLFDGANPYSGSLEPPGSGCLPTPGAVNECSTSVSTTRSGWGAIKARFGAR